MNGLTIPIDLAAVDGLVDGYASLVESAIRPAAQAGSQVIYDEVVRNVQRLGKKTGKLASAIYQAYSKDNSGPAKATYHISWNARKAPHGHLVEEGYLQRYEVVLSKKTGKWITLKNRPLAQPRHVPGHFFVRSATDKSELAAQAIETELFARIGGASGES